MQRYFCLYNWAWRWGWVSVWGGEVGLEVPRRGITLTKLFPKACLPTAHYMNSGWGPAILKTHLIHSCASYLMLLSVDPHFPSFMIWLKSCLPNKLSLTVLLCTDFTFWELELTNNWYHWSENSTKQACIGLAFILTISSLNSLVILIHLSHMDKEKPRLISAFEGFRVGSSRRQKWYLSFNPGW